MKIALLFTGGLDSTYVAWKLLEEGNEVDLYFVKVHWGGQHDPEEEAAKSLAMDLGCRLEILGEVDLPLAYGQYELPVILSMFLCSLFMTDVPKNYPWDVRRKYDAIATGLSPQLDKSSTSPYGNDADWQKLFPSGS